MSCAACGFENDAGARFCAGCGSPLGPVCESCGSHVEDRFAFCPTCGTVLTGEQREPSEERRFVSVLFADLVGSTELAEQLDPEDVRAFLGTVFENLRVELERYGGTVEKFIGDAVVAIFGAPVAHEDDPERAVRAALAVRSRVEELNAADIGGELHMRIGVNSGVAAVALQARPDGGEWMAAGDVVNTCARLQSAAPVDGILVGEATYRTTRDTIEYREVEPVRAKGKAEPVPAWEVVAARGTARPTVQRDAPLVGRANEVALLQEALARLRSQRSPELVTLLGAPGIGKSRLVLEFACLLDEDVTLLEGRSLPYGGGITFWALAEMAKSHAGIHDADDAATAEAKLRASVSELIADAEEARWVERHLRPLVGLGAEGELAGDRREAFAAWKSLFEAIAARSPLVLVFEDLQWADDGVLDFLDELMDWLTDVSVLVLATARPELLERRPGWGGGKRNAVMLSLSPLSDSDAAELLAALLERAVLPVGVRGELIARVAGNPLYAGEYVRMLVDRGLTRANGSELDVASVPLPESVQSIIAARLDTLPRTEKAALQDAAVLGHTIWADALAAVGELSPESARVRLRALERKEFLRRERGTAGAPEHSYGFRHSLVGDVAYGQIPRARRIEKHRRTAEWLETVAGDRAEDVAEMVAHHYLRALEYAKASDRGTAELKGRAWPALREAGDRAFYLNAYGASVRFYAAALEHAPNEDSERPELVFRLGRARFYAEQVGLDELTEARDALLAAGDRQLAAEAEVMMGALRMNEGDREGALDHLERASTLARDQGPSRAMAAALGMTSRLLMLAGEGPEAVRIGREALELAEQLELDDVRSQALITLGAARFLGGDAGGRGDLERGLEIAAKIRSPEAVRGYRFLASMHSLIGELKRSAELFAAGREAATRFGDAFNRRWLAAAQVLEFYWGGRWDEALALAEQFFVESQTGSHHYMESTCRRVRGQIRLARGDVTGASADAEESLAFARRAGDQWFLYPALAFQARTLLGDSAAAAVPADELLAAWRRAGASALVSVEAADLAIVLSELGRGYELRETVADVTLATRWLDAARAYASGDLEHAAETYREMGSLPDEAFTRLQLSRTALDAGRTADARPQLERALAFYRSVQATAFLDAAEPLRELV